MDTEIENRKSERISLGMSAIVKAKENEELFWKENADLISISRMGAGFYLPRECHIGQLVSLLLPMPKHLRQYDEEKELYRVWGVVQHCNFLTNTNEYHIGVAFTGKTSPESYQKNPQQSYRIVGMNDQGLWEVTEMGREFVNRRHARHWVSVEVSLSGLDEMENLISDLSAKTENISLSGAAIFSNLKIDVGESVKLNCQKFDFSTAAIVRNRQEFEDQSSKLHLEFLDNSFPIEKVLLSFEEPNEN